MNHNLILVLGVGGLLLGTPLLGHGEERLLVDMKAESLSLEETSGTETDKILPLQRPSRIDLPEGTDAHVGEVAFGANGEMVEALVMEKHSRSEEMNISFHWPKGNFPRTQFRADLKMALEKISGGANMSIVLKTENNARAIPRIQISNGGAVTLVVSSDDTRVLGELPLKEFFVFSIRIDYFKSEARIFVNDSPFGEPWTLESNDIVTQFSVFCNDFSGTRRFTFAEIRAWEVD